MKRTDISALSLKLFQGKSLLSTYNSVTSVFRAAGRGVLLVSADPGVGASGVDQQCVYYNLISSAGERTTYCQRIHTLGSRATDTNRGGVSHRGVGNTDGFPLSVLLRNCIRPQSRGTGTVDVRNV